MKAVIKRYDHYNNNNNNHEVISVKDVKSLTTDASFLESKYSHKYKMEVFPMMHVYIIPRHELTHVNVCKKKNT